MDEAKLSEIEAREKAATPGPWCAFTVDREGTTVETSSGEILMGALGSPDATSADAEFVAHARQDVPALVAEVRRLQKANEALVAAFDAALARSHDRITVSGHRAIVPQIERQH